MELDVHLTREAQEPWGFEIVEDIGIPLTIDKVTPSSPAAAAGLQPGDLITRLGDKLTTDMTLDAALEIIGEAIGSLSLGVTRGLYDPVLDDYEPIYETDPVDSDRRSATEVFQPLRFIEPHELSLTPNLLGPDQTCGPDQSYDPPNLTNGHNDLTNEINLTYGPEINSETPQDLLFTRSQTVSPFAINKTYRPFSTEPLEVPPLDDPIILNPDFKDEFGINKNEEKNDKMETIYKLPISEQYDPNYSTKVDEILQNIGKEKVFKTTKQDTITTIDSRTTASETHKGIDIENIETSKWKEIEISKESLKEVSKTEITESKDVSIECLKDEEFFEIDLKKIEQIASEIVEESIERAVSVTEEIKKEVEEELRASMSRDDIEVTQRSSQNVAIKEEEFTKAFTEVQDKKTERKCESIDNKSSEAVQQETTSKVNEKTIQDHREATEQLSYFEKATNVMEENMYDTEEFKNVETRRTAEKIDVREGKQMAYEIGLQTIPHIKGMIHSSHHFDLLLRTFFIHLTDVMVALSRFILTQPVNDLNSKAEKVMKEKIVSVGETFKSNQQINKQMKDQSQKQQTKTDLKSIVKSDKFKNEVTKTEQKSETVKTELIKNEATKKRNEVNEEAVEIEKRKLTGAKIAQTQQRKSKELTQKMDAVITEFENKTGIEEAVRSRSRSRSRIEEEVMSESDPLEWLDKTIQDKSTTTVKTEAQSNTISEEIIKSHKTKSGKQMYVAVVESHVYTNKDSILEEQLSETSSLHSNEEIQTALEVIDSFNQNVAVSSSFESQNIQKAEVIGNKKQVSETISGSEVRKSQLVESKDIMDSKTSKQELGNQEIVSNINSERVVQSKSEVTSAELTTAIVETTEVLEATQQILEEKSTKHEAIAQQELLTTMATETTEITAQSAFETVETNEASSKTATMITEDNYKATAVQSEATIEESNAAIKEVTIKNQKATTEIEPLQIASAEMATTITEDEVATFESTTAELKHALIKSEENYKKVAIETTEIALENVEEEHVAKLEKEAIVKHDTRHLSVAGIIETKAEQDKIQTKTYNEDEAALKIIKYQEIESNQENIEIYEEENSSFKSQTDINLQSTDIQATNVHKKLQIQTNLVVNGDNGENGDLTSTPTPCTVPPTPLTDEYVFTLTAPMPKNTAPIIVEATNGTADEDPHIVKKKLIPIVDAVIEDQILYDPPLQSPIEDKKPVYTKPGLKGGCPIPKNKREYINEIERKSSLLASAIDETIKSIEEYKEEFGVELPKEEPAQEVETEKEPEIELTGFKKVEFNPGTGGKRAQAEVPVPEEGRQSKLYTDDFGVPIGTVQGIVDGLEEAVVDENVAKELGKPGITEDKIAELISGESEMLREAHVMGLTRVISSHMHRPEDSVDFNKIKPLVESLKDSEVLKALNEELLKQAEERKKKDDKKWTTFLQKPKRPVPKSKYGYHGYVTQNIEVEQPYLVKIVKQPKPKVAPDFKKEDFETGPLPWEERALAEPPPPPVEPEEPILIPEEGPEFLEAVDPLPESEVPDLEDTGIPLPPPRQLLTPEAIEPIDEVPEEDKVEETVEEAPQEAPVKEEMQNPEQKTEKLVESVKNMVDPNAPLEQQLSQMRAQLAALAQLPCVIQQSLEMLTRQLMVMGQQGTHVEERREETRAIEESYEHNETLEEERSQTQVVIEEMLPAIEESKEETSPLIQENNVEHNGTIEENNVQVEVEQKQKKEQAMQEQMRMEQESRQLKQRPTPRVGKPKPVFGPPNPEARPLVLPGGRRWRGPKDAYNEQMFTEALQGQAEIIQGKVMGFESDKLPYDNRINFMKYEKPPVSLDHLQHSEVYKVVHNMDQAPLKRVDFLTPVVAEADYRERCRSATPSQRIGGPQQLQP